MEKHNLILTQKSVLVYRGQYGKSPDIETRLGSFSFSSKEVASHYALHANAGDGRVCFPKVFPVWITIRQPIQCTPGDAFLELDHYTNCVGLENAIRLATKYRTWIQRTDTWSSIAERYGVLDVIDYISLDKENVKNLIVQLYPVLDDLEEIAVLKQFGYDGAIYAGSGVSAGELEYRVFDSSQFTYQLSSFI